MGLIETVLVDDDQMALEYLEELIDWKAAGFHIAGKALDGHQGWLLCQRLHPGLVISDVRMPVMDGIDLAEKILKEEPNTCVLLLSNFDEFSYVRQAMRMGIRDYILKHELDHETLLNKLSTVKEDLSRMSRQNWDAAADFVRECFTQPLLPHAKSNLLDRQFQFLLVREALPFAELSRVAGYEDGLSETEMGGILRETWPRSNEVKCTVQVGRGLYLAVLDAGPGISLMEERQKIFFGARELSQKLKQKFPRPWSVFTFSTPSTLLQAGTFFQKHIEMLDLCWFQASGFTGEWTEFIQQKRPPTPNILPGEDPWKTLSISVDAQNYSLFIQAAQRILQQILNDQGLLAVNWNTACKEWYTAQNFYRWAKEYSNRLEAGWSQPVRRAVECIREQYRDPDLSVNKIAEVVAMSRSRLSTLFRQEIGQGINEYLAQYRLDRALQLMEEGQYKIYEISEMVGYSSSQYFCRVFKKQKGYTPFSYRKKDRR